jgi:hypothetical protein
MTHSVPFAVRGVVEGFYGVYYTHQQRLELLGFMAKHGLNTYVYGPKNDRLHRTRWREPYPADALAQFADVVRAARELGITFCYGLSPGVHITYSSEQDFACVLAKLGSLYDTGVRAFSLFLDDIAAEFSGSADGQAFASFAAAHICLCNRVLDWLNERPEPCSLSMCPTIYHGLPPYSDYLHELGARLRPDIGVFYTGPDVCSATLPPEAVAAFARAVQRPPLIWDNYPVNDLAMAGDLHLGPILGRGRELAGLVAGMLVNPMNQPQASRVALATYAEFLQDPAAYEPEAAWRRAIAEVAGDDSAGALGRIAELARASCLESGRALRLERIVAATLASMRAGEAASGSEAVAELRAWLAGLDEAAYHVRNRMANLALRDELLPWLDVLDQWHALGQHSLGTLLAIEKGEPVARPLRQLSEARAAIERHLKRLACQALLAMADYAVQQAERHTVVPALDTRLLDTARRHAEAVLLANGGDLGLLGANKAYQQVWARDSMICGLGLWLCQGSEGGAINARSLDTLGRFQSPLGKIPHNVGYTQGDDPALVAHGGRLTVGGQERAVVEDSIHAGCVDGNLWFIVGHYNHFVHGRDLAMLQQAWPRLERALLWLRYQDSNECGLLEVHEAMDWADLFANRYNVLFDNVLYYAAWKCMAQMATALGHDSSGYAQQAEDVRRKVNTLLWVGPEAPTDFELVACERKEWLYPLRRVETELVQRPFYLPYMAFRDYADRFDTLGNLLAIIFGVASHAQAEQIINYIDGCGLNLPFPVRAVYPVLQPGDGDWREYYRVRNLNQPHHYHNGGAWPFIGGLYVAALVQAGRLTEAAQQLEKLTAMVRLGREREWEFNEWHHGISGRPMGFGGQSWSAAMYLLAHNAVTRERVSVFNADNGWELRAP